MRKYELWIAFVLAMILMFLASCKSKQVTINEQVDSVSVSTFSLADMRSQMLDFSFDSMEIVVPGDSNSAIESIGHKSVFVKIKGGRMRAESQESRAESREKKDSVKVKSEYHEEKRAEPYKLKGLVIIMICSIVFAIGIFGFVYIKLKEEKI